MKKHEPQTSEDTPWGIRYTAIVHVFLVRFGSSNNFTVTRKTMKSWCCFNPTAERIIEVVGNGFSIISCVLLIIKGAFRLNSKLRGTTTGALVCRSHDVIWLWQSMFYHRASINVREIPRECREMPFRFIALCLKFRNLGPEMTTTHLNWKHSWLIAFYINEDIHLP